MFVFVYKELCFLHRQLYGAMTHLRIELTARQLCRCVENCPTKTQLAHGKSQCTAHEGSELHWLVIGPSGGKGSLWELQFKAQSLH